MVVRMQLSSLSCKQRIGPANDDAEDIQNDKLYACLLPLVTVSLPHIPDPALLDGATPPPYALAYSGPNIVPLQARVGEEDDSSSLLYPWVRATLAVLAGVGAGVMFSHRLLK